ncbi:MAG: AAA family ATPase, partial [Actinobacteria bacterium]|nr:AAA family ATPase [Actinomycetota bacterium]
MSSRIVLIGPPGSGKTSVGKILAEELKLKAIDTDREIEEKSGKKIGDIFLEVGELGFRKIEREVVLDALKREVLSARVVPNLDAVCAVDPDLSVIHNDAHHAIGRTFCTGKVEWVNRSAIKQTGDP